MLFGFPQSQSQNVNMILLDWLTGFVYKQEMYWYFIGSNSVAWNCNQTQVKLKNTLEETICK